MRKGSRGSNARPTSLRFPTDDRDLAYLAGIIDGEGCLHVPRNGGAPLLAVTNTDEALIDWLSQLGGYVSPVRRTNGQSHWKPAWLWQVHGQADLAALIQRVLPYLKAKETEARAVLERIWERQHV